MSAYTALLDGWLRSPTQKRCTSVNPLIGLALDRANRVWLVLGVRLAAERVTKKGTSQSRSLEVKE